MGKLSGSRFCFWQHKHGHIAGLKRWFELFFLFFLHTHTAPVLTPSAVTWLALSRCLSLALSWGWLLRQGNSLHSHTRRETHTHWPLWLIEWPGQEVQVFMLVERSHEYLCFIWTSHTEAVGKRWMSVGTNSFRVWIFTFLTALTEGWECVLLYTRK